MIQTLLRSITQKNITPRKEMSRKRNKIKREAKGLLSRNKIQIFSRREACDYLKKENPNIDESIISEVISEMWGS